MRRTRHRSRLILRGLAAATSITLLAALPAPASAAPVAGTDVLYTTDADFDGGVLQDVNHDAPNNDQLQLTRSTVFFPYVNVAASARGTMLRIDVNTGATGWRPPGASSARLRRRAG